MYQFERITDALFPVVGWQQSFDPQHHIDAALTTSESGLYYDAAHPLVTLANIRKIMPDDYGWTYPTYSATAVYHNGDKVTYNNANYVCIGTGDVTGETPSSSDAWDVYDLVNDYIRRLMRDNVAKVINEFLTRKSLLRESRPLLERRVFFDGAGRRQNTVANTSNIVGFEILPVKSTGVTTIIQRVGLQMIGATGDVRLYVFDPTQTDPIYTKDVHIAKGDGSFEWFDVEWFLPYRAGRSYFVCYNQDDLPAGMEAINAGKDWSTEPCGTCNRGSLEEWRELTKYMMISPFRVHALETFAEYPEMWDTEENTYTNANNYGLNCVVTVGCDLTDFIIAQRSMFANVMQKQMAATVLRLITFNPDVRVNRNQSNASQFDLLYEVDGNPQGRKTGIGAELDRAYDALDLDTRGIDRICLTCRPVGVRYSHT